MLDKLQESKDFLFRNGFKDAKLGIILGTGLGGLVNHIEIEKSINYTEIPNFPESTVETHSGKLIYGKLNGTQAIIMSGRFHFYEGYSLQEVTLPVRVMHLLGVHTLFVSNAAGGINPDFEAASLMIIDDHINMLPGNPLVGKNHSKLGPRFVDMSEPYDAELIKKMESIAHRLNIRINKGFMFHGSAPALKPELNTDLLN